MASNTGQSLYPKYYQGYNSVYNYYNDFTELNDIKEWDNTKKYEINDLVQYKGNVYKASKFIYLSSATGVDPVSSKTNLYGRDLRVWHCIGDVNYYIRKNRYSNNKAVWLPDDAEQLDKPNDPIYGEYINGEPITVYPNLSTLETYYGDLTYQKESNFVGRISYGWYVDVICLYNNEGLTYLNIDPDGGNYNKPYEDKSSLVQRYNSSSPYNFDEKEDVYMARDNQQYLNSKYDSRAYIIYEDGTRGFKVGGTSDNGMSGYSKELFYNYKEGINTQYYDYLNGSYIHKPYEKIPNEDKNLLYVLKSPKNNYSPRGAGDIYAIEKGGYWYQEGTTRSGNPQIYDVTNPWYWENRNLPDYTKTPVVYPDFKTKSAHDSYSLFVILNLNGYMESMYHFYGCNLKIKIQVKGSVTQYSRHETTTNPYKEELIMLYNIEDKNFYWYNGYYGRGDANIHKQPYTDSTNWYEYDGVYQKKQDATLFSKEYVSKVYSLPSSYNHTYTVYGQDEYGNDISWKEGASGSFEHRLIIEKVE